MGSEGDIQGLFFPALKFCHLQDGVNSILLGVFPIFPSQKGTKCFWGKLSDLQRTLLRLNKSSVL